MRYIFILFIPLALGIAACGNNEGQKGNTSASSVPTAAPESNLAEPGTGKLMEVVKKYFSLKNALVATKSADVTNAAGLLATEATGFLASLQNDSLHKPVLTPYLDTIIAQGKIITTLTDETCEQQRIAFERISKSVYELAKKAELKNARVYHQYCPMAFNDKGAYWLSNESDIRNPYFGDKMLECGEVTDSL